MSCHIGIDNGRIQYNTLSPIPNRQHTVNCGWPHPYNRLKQWTNQDHPRACGANCWLIQSHTALNGSSPRMRGKRSHRPGCRSCRRIIPAHAGQTHDLVFLAGMCADHPRACGANDDNTAWGNTTYGSSPRMRGKPDLFDVSVDWLRIIPAHAGQTCTVRQSDTATVDHPRACGTNSLQHLTILRSDGSSPRMRDKPVGEPFPCVAVRIIPAHAGQTLAFASPLVRVTDHPRACGANFGRHGLVDGVHGSSPRMRGKRTIGCFLDFVPRIIPAHAGQTNKIGCKP